MKRTPSKGNDGGHDQVKPLPGSDQKQGRHGEDDPGSQRFAG
jgi:hypothetical protein